MLDLTDYLLNQAPDFKDSTLRYLIRFVAEMLKLTLGDSVILKYSLKIHIFMKASEILKLFVSEDECLGS